MKKLSVLLLVISTSFLFTGCLKTYKTVDDYNTAMLEVQKNHPSYTLEVKKTINVNKPDEIYFKSYKKGNKWKAEATLKGQKEIYQILLNDGTDIYSYTPGGKFAIALPKIKDKDFGVDLQKISNPIYGLFDWKSPDPILKDDSAPVFVNEKDSKNGFQCRLISFGEHKEICVNDEYGIAVYEKTQFLDKKGNKSEFITDVISIDTSEINDDTFMFPEGVQKMSLDTILSGMKSAFQNLKKQ